MKLSQLVAHLRHLETFNVDQARGILHQYISPILYAVETNEVQLYGLTEQLTNDLEKIKSDVNEFDQTLAMIKRGLQDRIARLEMSYFSNSYDLYDQGMRHDSPEYILNRRFSLDPEVKEYLNGRILPYSDWRFPGMVIRPGREEWVDQLVGLDPLYLVDESWELLDPVKDRYPVEYQKRLRFYLIDEFKSEYQDQNLMAAMPNDQFGFVFAYNFFHYKPFELIKKYFREIYQKLRPGGAFAFTYNDCDRPGGVELAERNFNCYTPGSMLVAYANSVGFELREKANLNQAVGWLELVKPGKLTTLRGGQALAKTVVG